MHSVTVLFMVMYMVVAPTLLKCYVIVKLNNACISLILGCTGLLCIIKLWKIISCVPLGCARFSKYIELAGLLFILHYMKGVVFQQCQI